MADNRSNFRQATGGSSVARLQNFLRANEGNTQKLQSQVQSAIEGQAGAADRAFEYTDPAYYRDKTDDTFINAATSGVNAAQNLSNLNNQLQTRSGLQNVVQAATKSSSPYQSGIDTYLLAKDPSKVQSIQASGEKGFQQQFGKVNQLLTRSGLSPLQENVIRNRKQASLADFYNQPVDGEEYTEVYEDGGEEGSFSGDLRGTGANAFQKALSDSPQDRLDAAGQILSTVFGGGAGAAVYNALPENMRYKAFDVANKVGTATFGEDYTKNVFNPQSAISDPKKSLFNNTTAGASTAAIKNITDKLVGEKVRKQVTEALGVKKAQDAAARAVSSIGGSVGRLFKKLCFEKHTEFLMADGTVKKICDIQVNDEMMIGGFVYSISSHKVDYEYWWDYKGILVTGSHAVFENGEWTRVETSDHGKMTCIPVDVVYTLCNTDHRMVAKDKTIFADFDEVEHSEYLDLNQCLRKLNHGS